MAGFQSPGERQREGMGDRTNAAVGGARVQLIGQLSEAGDDTRRRQHLGQSGCPASKQWFGGDSSRARPTVAIREGPSGWVPISTLATFSRTTRSGRPLRDCCRGRKGLATWTWRTGRTSIPWWSRAVRKPMR